MSDLKEDGVETAPVGLVDFSSLRTAEECSGYSLSELQWDGLSFATVSALIRSGVFLVAAPEGALTEEVDRALALRTRSTLRELTSFGADWGRAFWAAAEGALEAQVRALVLSQTALLSTQRVSVQGSSKARRIGVPVPPLSTAAAGRAGLSSGQLTARLQAAGPPSERLHDGRPATLPGASSSNHVTLQTYPAAQGSATPPVCHTLPEAPLAAQPAGSRSPVAGNLDAARFLAAPVQQNNDLLGALTKDRLGSPLDYSDAEVLPQRAQEDPEELLGHPRWVGANLAYFKDVVCFEDRAKLVSKQPPWDRPRRFSPEPKAKPKEVPKAAAKTAAAGSETQ